MGVVARRGGKRCRRIRGFGPGARRAQPYVIEPGTTLLMGDVACTIEAISQ